MILEMWDLRLVLYISSYLCITVLYGQEVKVAHISGSGNYGNNLTIQCRALNANIDKIFWLLNDDIIFTASQTNDNNSTFSIDKNVIHNRLKIDVNQTFSELTITNMIDEFDGRFHCFVKRKNSTKFQYDSYNNSIIPDKRSVHETTSDDLICDYDFMPDNKNSTNSNSSSANITSINHTKLNINTYSWYKDGVLIAWDSFILGDKEKYNISKIGVLAITNATFSDSGTYNCQRNEDKIKSIEVTVNKIPTTTTVTTTISTTPEKPFLEGSNGYVIGVSIGVIILLIILITTCLQREFPIQGYTTGALKATKDFLLCSAFRKKR